MKSVFDSSDGGKSVPEKCLHIGLILWPRYSLLAVSGLLEALRYAAKAQDKLAFKISLISEFPDIPIISNAGIIMRPDSPMRRRTVLTILLLSAVNCSIWT